MQGLHSQSSGHKKLRRGALSRLGCALGLLLSLIVPACAPAQPHKPSQYDVQAVYLYDFAHFVRWPASAAEGKLDFCIAGQEFYIDALNRIAAGETIEGRPVGVRRVDRPEDENGCSILFIGTMAREHMEGLLAASAGKPILTVSDIPDFLDRGGMIQFLLINHRVRFGVDLQPVQRSGISLSSELLKVAVKVNGKPPTGGVQ
jgi:hypothetical protein